MIHEQGPTNGNRYFNIRDSDGSLITRETYNSIGTRTMSRTYHFDGLGNTVALSDEAGAVTDNYTYDAWGNVTHTSGTTSDNPYQYVGEYGYYTHYQEPDFKLLSLGVRFYDPSLGRFTQLDPVKDGANWYGYVGGEPLGAADPSGRIWAAIPIVCAIGAGLCEWLLNDWGTSDLTAGQRLKVDRQIALLRKCARTEHSPVLEQYLSKLYVVGRYDRTGNGEVDSDSRTLNGTCWGLRARRTVLAADYFDKDFYSQLRTLVHEAYHTATGDWKEGHPDNYARSVIENLRACIDKEGAKAREPIVEPPTVPPSHGGYLPGPPPWRIGLPPLCE